MACIFDVNDLQNSLNSLKRDLIKRFSLFKRMELDSDGNKVEVLKSLQESGESFGITPENVDSAMEVLNNKILWAGIKDSIPSKEEMRNAFIAWQKPKGTPEEDTSAERLTDLSKTSPIILENPIDVAYGYALKAKIRANLHANSVSVNSVLYTQNGIIDSVNDLNNAIEAKQEELLQSILNFIRSKHPDVLPDAVMYKEGKYTGILETIHQRFGYEFEFSPNQLNDLYNNNNFTTLDAYSSWVILNNFDTILQNTFGKAIEIDPDKALFTLGKYSIAGGSNVYSTWRTNEEIDLSKEINNITQAIVSSLKYYTADSATPSIERNLKFNEFVYIISRLKAIPLHANSDLIIDNNMLSGLSQETKDFLKDKSLLSVIKTIRDNPQKVLPALMEFMNKKTNFQRIEDILEPGYFYSIDRDLINTIYQGLFSLNNDESLYRILHLNNGFQGTNYFAFLTEVIDTMYKSDFRLYFRNVDGEIYVRDMYDLSISNIEFNIEQGINALNRDIISNTNYENNIRRFNPADNATESETLPEGFELDINGKMYFIHKDTKVITDNSGNVVSDPNIVNKFKEQIKARFYKPTIVSYTINDFYKGPLLILVNLNKGKIDYSVNGSKISFLTKKDYDSLSDVIETILKQHFNYDLDYLNAYLNRIGHANMDNYGKLTEDMMLLVSRVITNLYLLNEYISHMSYVQRKTRLPEIFPDTYYRPTFNIKANSLNFLTDRDAPIIRNLAQAKALVTGRLTSSLIISGEGNALGATTLSRLVNSLDYLIEKQVLLPGSAAQEFSLWKPGVYRGVAQLKEIKDNSSRRLNKDQVKMSSKEMEEALVFIDFVQGLTNNASTKSPLTDGVVLFYPSENSDKTYVGRLSIDLKAIQVGESNLYDLIRTNPSNVTLFYPIIFKELGDFYRKAEININTDWKRVGNLLGINISYGNWSELETLAANLLITPAELVESTVTEYNFNNPTNPIVLIDLVHYIKNKNGNYEVNNSFLANLRRFSSQGNFNAFIENLNFQILKKLLEDRVSVTANQAIKSLVGSTWIDENTNKVILAKDENGSPIRKARDLKPGVTNITLNPIISTYNTLNYFFTQEYMNSSVGAYYAHPNKKHENIQPLVDNGLISSKEMWNKYFADEKARKVAQDKRNVAITAAMHAFQKNLLQGIPSDINIAMIPDVFDEYQTISGEKFKIKPYDGATFTNPFFQILQNNSLGGAKVGTVKKTFTHYYDSRTGTGGIIKTAEFPLTNEWMKRSKQYLVMMQNMTDRIWRDEIGNPVILDILTDYNGKPIDYANHNSVYGGIYFLSKSTGKFYQLEIQKTDQPNTYIRNLREVDNAGNPLGDWFSEPESWVVNTNFNLWKILGGETSMQLERGKLIPSEYSILQVVKVMNNTGIKKNNIVKTQEDIYQPMKHSDIHLMPTEGAVKLGLANMNNRNIYSVADASKVNFMRIKANQMGVLLDKEHHADGSDLSLMTLVISACASRGYTQEESQDLYNALASLAEAGLRPYLKGFEEFFTFSNGLNTTNREVDKEYKYENVLSKHSEEARQKFENVLLKTLVDALMNSTNNSATLLIVAQRLIDLAKEGKDIDFANLKIPLSDPSVMRRLHSTISVALTQAAIKIKVDGSLNVLCPSYGIVKVFNDKMGDDYLSEAELIKDLKEKDSNSLFNLVGNLSRIKLGRTYKLIPKNNPKFPILREIKTPEDYWNLKLEAYKYSSIRELFAPMDWTEHALHTVPHPDVIKTQINKERSLNGKIQKAIDLKLLHTSDLEPRDLYEFVVSRIGGLSRADIAKELGYQQGDLNKLLDIHKGGKKTITLLSEEIAGELIGTPMETDSTEIRNIIIDALLQASTSSDILLYIPKQRLQEVFTQAEEDYEDEEDYLELNIVTHHFDGGRELGSYNVTFSGNIDTVFGSLVVDFNLYDLVSVRNLVAAQQTKDKNIINQALAELQKDLIVLHKRSGQVVTDQGLVTIIPNSVQIEPYEIVMPKIFKSVFGLDTNDDLNSIKADPQFFTKRLLQNIQPKIDKYSISFIRVDGNHTYVLDSKNAVLDNNFKPKYITKTRKNGKLYRTQGNEILYEIGENDSVWEYIDPNGTSIEVIVTDIPTDYIDRVDYVTLNLNINNDPVDLDRYLDVLRKSGNKAIETYLEMVDGLTKNIQDEDIYMAIEDAQDVNIKNWYGSKAIEYYKRLGNLIYASFLKSLEVVAARIPAQSMQSFMPMKVVGFERSNINTAYVSTTQFLFLGSDLDIDAVSLASYAFDKSGRYIIHSPLANIDSFELLKASQKLPFPTGKLLEIDEDNEPYDYSQIFDIFEIGNGSKVKLKNDTPENLIKLGNFIKMCNRLGYIPRPVDMEESLNLAVNTIKQYINKHNNYINESKNVALFAKNYVTSAMYDIGMSPANLIVSQQAMDSITAPLKKAAEATLKAMEISLDNPGSFTTNVHGFVLNMDGKSGVGICAVGLKSFFAATARYNEVLAHGTPNEVARLESDVFIAKKRFKMLANTYTTNEVNKAILGEIIDLLDQGTDAAIVLSALLSLATDNAKELALSKLNAANMLGMYIYGISIGMDFSDLSKIISSKTGQVIDSLIREDAINLELGMSMENIFDYMELGPKLPKIERGDELKLKTYIFDLSNLRALAWNNVHDGILYNTLGEKLRLLESFKINPNNVTEKNRAVITDFNNNIEAAQDYMERVDIIKNELILVSTGVLSFKNDSENGYTSIKKLYSGGEELRRLGLCLHINQGNFTSYSDAINYINTIESVIAARLYANYRERIRYNTTHNLEVPKTDDSKKYNFNFTKYLYNKDYREALIDLYGGLCNEEMYLNSSDYRSVFENIYGKGNSPEEKYREIKRTLKPSKVFFNILDILQVPHYRKYLESANMLHLYMQNAIKYRAIYNLGKTAIEEIGAYSSKDKQAVYKRVELFVDRLIRDRFFIRNNITVQVPLGSLYFVKTTDGIKIKTAINSDAIIRLGTREGNASFKKLMEEVVIPQLQQLPEFRLNKFIQSLSGTAFEFNPEFLTTYCYAPNINMSPRSEADVILFEAVKHDFNELRTTRYKFPLGDENWSLIELFHYYNLIAFGGRVGENTLTNIFANVLDYGSLAAYRDYESYLDKKGSFELYEKEDRLLNGSITLDTLLREVAPRANELTTNLSHFYQEDYRTGELQFKSRNERTSEYIDGALIKLGKYSSTAVSYSDDADLKNYIVNSEESDIRPVKIKFKGGLQLTFNIEKGTILKFTIDGHTFEIPKSERKFFSNLPTMTRITTDGVIQVYNRDLILSKMEEIVSCKV